MTMHQISSHEKMRGVRKISKIRREGTRDEINRQQRRRKGEMGHGAGVKTTNGRKGRFSGANSKKKRQKTREMKKEQRRDGGTAILRMLLNDRLRACCIGRRKVKS
jgi:hypothetical protein